MWSVATFPRCIVRGVCSVLGVCTVRVSAQVCFSSVLEVCSDAGKDVYLVGVSKRMCIWVC